MVEIGHRTGVPSLEGLSKCSQQLDLTPVSFSEKCVDKSCSTGPVLHPKVRLANQSERVRSAAVVPKPIGQILGWHVTHMGTCLDRPLQAPGLAAVGSA